MPPPLLQHLLLGSGSSVIGSSTREFITSRARAQLVISITGAATAPVLEHGGGVVADHDYQVHAAGHSSQLCDDALLISMSRHICSSTSCGSGSDCCIYRLRAQLILSTNLTHQSLSPYYSTAETVIPAQRRSKSRGTV